MSPDETDIDDRAETPRLGPVDWLEDHEPIAPRPRRRALGLAQVVLVGVLLVVCGFFGGVLAEKGSANSSGATTAVLRTGGFSRAAGARSGSFPFAAGGAPGASGSGASVTSGEVAYVDHGTLYVTTTEGGTVKVATSAGTTITKSVTTSAADVRPGESVVVTGTRGANGAITARRVVVGSVSGSSLFGGGASASAGSSSSGGSGSSSSGSTPQLFGPG